MSPRRDEPRTISARDVAVALALGLTAIAGTADARPPGSPATIEIPPTADRPGEPAMDESTQAVVEGNTRFALDLHARLREEHPGNLFYSPASLSTALAMAYAGARGATAEQMAEVLHLGAPPEAGSLHDAFAALRAAWDADDPAAGYRLSVANRLWGQQDFDFHRAYLDLTRDAYGAELARVDFRGRAEQVRAEINAWVEEQTAGKITDLIPRGALGAMTRLVLTNAVYFQGDWTNPFRPEATRDDPFNLSADRSANVPMMHRTGRYKFWAGDGLKVLELPYGRAGAMVMQVILPDDVDGLDALEDRLSAESLGDWTKGLRMQEVIVALPRFKLTSQFELAKTLGAMGMPRAFSAGEADFTGMSTEEELYLSAVVHKAYVDVHEKGTEAAAATGIAVAATSALVPRQPPPEFRADHPFLFLIRDTRTGSLLFLGRFARPEG